MKYAKVLATIILSAIIAQMILPIIIVATSDNDVLSTTYTVGDYTASTEEAPVEITEPTEEQLIDTPILYSEVGYEVPITYWNAKDSQDALRWYIDDLKVAIESGTYTTEAVTEMEKEVDRLEADINKFEDDINVFNQWMKEYPEATEVWFYLRNLGYSEVVVAGIVGNMMIETSGGTLDLKPNVYGVGHYGLCQWSLYYKPFMADKTLHEQLDFLVSDMEYEFNTFGFCYKSGFTYNDFIVIDNCRDAAIAFAKAYERPGGGTYSMRADCAEVAYNYFTNK
jgi:hypothetical protein